MDTFRQVLEMNPDFANAHYAIAEAAAELAELEVAASGDAATAVADGLAALDAARPVLGDKDRFILVAGQLELIQARLATDSAQRRWWARRALTTLQRLPESARDEHTGAWAAEARKLAR
jgi:hypothetical protein